MLCNTLWKDTLWKETKREEAIRIVKSQMLKSNNSSWRSMTCTSTKSVELKQTPNRLDDKFIQKITQIIEDNLRPEKTDRAYLSGKPRMSKSTLYRKVKALTGISTNEYVRKVTDKAYIYKSCFFLKQVSFHRKKSNLQWKENYNRKFWF